MAFRHKTLKPLKLFPLRPRARAGAGSAWFRERRRGVREAGGGVHANKTTQPVSAFSAACPPSLNIAHTRQPKPDSSLVHQVNVLQPFQGVPSSRESGMEQPAAPPHSRLPRHFRPEMGPKFVALSVKIPPYSHDIHNPWAYGVSTYASQTTRSLSAFSAAGCSILLSSEE